jgi:O-antigen/teichoic acid export membrane protein
MKLYKTIFKFGFPLGLNNILYFVYSRIDRLLLGAMINPIGVAYYEVASRIPNKSQQLYGSFNNVFFPNISEYIAKKNYREAEKILNNSLRLISFATIFATVIATIFRKEIIILLFSKMYIESATVLSIMMVSLSITITGTILGTSLVALGQSDKPVKINLVNAATNVVCNLILIPIFGFMGAAYAALLSHSIALPFYVWFLKKSKIRLEITHYLKPLLGYCLLLAIFILIGPVSIITKLTLIMVFLIFCICLSIIRKKDILHIFEVLKPSLQVIK